MPRPAMIPFARWRFPVLVSILAILLALPATAQVATAQVAKRAPSHQQDELAVRQAIMSDVAAMLVRRDFTGLDDLAETFRAGSARTPSGTWKLEWFYQAIEAIGQNPPPDSGPSPIAAVLRAWIDAHPESPTPYVALGHFEYWQALSIWHRRSITAGIRQDFAPFQNALATTYEFLTQAKPVAARDPEWYVVMEHIGRLIQIDLAERFLLIQEGLDQAPHYHRIYFAGTVGLLPDWGGSYRMVEAFAREAVARTQAVEGDALYARIYWSISREKFGPDIFQETGADWSAFSRGFRDIIKAHPGTWNLNAFTRFACAAGDAEEAKRLFDQINNDLVPHLWQGSARFIDFCRELAARGRPAPAKAAQPASLTR